MSDQVGGDHYAKMKIQPWDFVLANRLGVCEANALKYICRHNDKGGREDLEKAITWIEKLIEVAYPEEEPKVNTTAWEVEWTQKEQQKRDDPFRGFKESLVETMAEHGAKDWENSIDTTGDGKVKQWESNFSIKPVKIRRRGARGWLRKVLFGDP